MSPPRILLTIIGAAVCHAAEPKLNSIHPIAGMRGEPFTITVRGTAIKNATGVFASGSPLSFTIAGTDVDPSKGRNAADLVRLRVETPADTAPGAYMFRVVTPGGVSNALPIRITSLPIADETEGSHETPDTAIAVTAPAIRAGRILRRGEFDLYAIDAKAGETFTFEAISGLPAPGAAGGNAAGFDPSITILEPGGSWFDPTRLKRLAFNDEPLWVLGDRTDAHFPYTFARAGRYYIRVEAFSGQGGPDYSYEFKVSPGEQPQDPAPPMPKQWSERGYTRRLSADRLNELAARGAKPQNQKSIETFGPSNFKFPGTLTGAIAKPGDSQRASFHIDGPQDIAIEIETETFLACRVEW